MNGRDALRAQQSSPNGQGPADRWSVMFDAKGALLLPEVADRDDLAGHCAWLTATFNLDGQHPITGGCRQGLAGPEGHVVLSRAEAPEIRFEPATRINTPAKLVEALSWQMTARDGAIHALKAEHCRQIAHVVRMLCAASGMTTAKQEAEGIIGTFLHSATAVEDHTTYGTPAQRYEAAVALRRDCDDVTGRPVGPPRYLIDANTGELVIGAADLQDAARRHTGSSLARGWLDARIEAAGWGRVTLQGYGLPGRSGRTGPHARITAYRGILTIDQTDQNPVNT
jgi:hypothetical protein